MASRGFSLQEAVSADLDEMTRMLGSHRKDTERSGHSEEAHAVSKAMLQCKMTVGLEIGAIKDTKW
jgi:hypothetical protein